MSRYLILAINPGSTSTKIAVFENEYPVFIKNIRHASEDLIGFKKITDQFSYRKDIIMKELKDHEINTDDIKAIVGRGGLVKPIASGIYEVNELMKEDLHKNIIGEHASNLGALIADDIAKNIPNAKAYIADPVVVDELQEVARIAGHPRFKRISIFHALNQKAIARAHANLLNKQYSDLNLIIAHLGGGISVGAHCHGRVIDVNNGLDGDGPFSPERSGTLPVGQLVNLCFSGEFTKSEVETMIKGKGGYVGYLGTNDAYEVELRAYKGDEQAKLIQEAMAYQVAKEIGALSVVLKGKVDAILLTGGVAKNSSFVEYIKNMVSFIAPVYKYQGEDEMQTLAMNGLMVLKGLAVPKIYS